MAKQENIHLTGVVKDKHANATFDVELENAHIVKCGISGKIRIHNINIIVGDKVEIAVSMYDLNKGTIVTKLTERTHVYTAPKRRKK